ncbi:CTP-dependent riboflavin kinase [Candidatus Woesearchaeota archaeon]|nr:CTP-dependent riboflavin kinase [Candidatus Woesearchaeota archaeon]
MKNNLTLKGILVKGLGKAGYFIKKQGYKNSFIELLGYTPWPGTLNIKLTLPFTTDVLDKIKPIIIEGFKEKDKTFGKIKCYPCIISEDIKTHLIIPEKTKYDKNIIEIISPIYLRKALNITDDDKIIIELR